MNELKIGDILCFKSDSRNLYLILTIDGTIVKLICISHFVNSSIGAVFDYHKSLISDSLYWEIL